MKRPMCSVHPDRPAVAFRLVGKSGTFKSELDYRCQKCTDQLKGTVMMFGVARG